MLRCDSCPEPIRPDEDHLHVGKETFHTKCYETRKNALSLYRQAILVHDTIYIRGERTQSEAQVTS